MSRNGFSHQEEGPSKSLTSLAQQWTFNMGIDFEIYPRLVAGQITARIGGKACHLAFGAEPA
jgi:hypothetical protein